MQITTLCDIVNGELLNSPSISFITQTHTNISKVNEGDLFISNDLNDIKEAIQKGAFAIIFSENYDIKLLDQEIAWIKVDNLKEVLFKILRFQLSHIEIKSYASDDTFFEFSQKLLTNKRKIKFLTNDIFVDFENIKNIENINFLFSSDYEYLSKIQPLCEKIQIKQFDVTNLTIHSLFKTSFSYSGYMFKQVELSYLYINHFLTLLELVLSNKEFETTIDMHGFRNIEIFTPIFIDSYFDIVDFGKSNKLIISSNLENLYDQEIEFINQYYKFGKVSIINKFNNDQDLLDQIKRSNTNIIYVCGKSKVEVETLLKGAKKEDKGLFA